MCNENGHNSTLILLTLSVSCWPGTGHAAATTKAASPMWRLHCRPNENGALIEGANTRKKRIRARKRSANKVRYSKASLEINELRKNRTKRTIVKFTYRQDRTTWRCLPMCLIEAIWQKANSNSKFLSFRIISFYNFLKVLWMRQRVN